MNALVVWFLGALALLISCCGPASAQSATEDHSSSESTSGELTEPPAAPEPDPPPRSRYGSDWSEDRRFSIGR